jgi:hypothetical protein
LTKSDSEKPARSKLPIEESRIVIRPDGEVVIENLSERLVDVALELDPDADLACDVEDAETSQKETAESAD